MINRGEGLTGSEKYLKALCERTFLSLWSFTNVYREPGKELCDILIVAGDDIIIFSDKQCHFSTTIDADLAWRRWFKSAIADSARQLWGAEKWLRKHCDSVFLDSACKKKFPIPIQICDKTKFHLVLVAHGASTQCRELHGGSGSLFIDTRIKGLNNHCTAFTVGELDGQRSFVHVLDDFTLRTVLLSRDTISDFTAYLRKKEQFLRCGLPVICPGEENMLASYLISVNDNNEHDFVLPASEQVIEGVEFEDGGWIGFQKHPQRLAQIAADNISYMWDNLIEQFSKHALAGTQYHVSEGGFTDSEVAIRFLALESRYSRRQLSMTLNDMIINTPKDLRRIRVAPRPNGTYHVFLLLPFTNEYSDGTYERYRWMRQQMLEICCFITRLKYSDAKFVVGIAMESGTNPTYSSEDLMCFDCSQWDEELETQTKKDQKDFRILLNLNLIEHNIQEYPL
ncbi:MAG: hypothetical protein H7257_02995 [Taibaiella sp.]|nr:hypothetical protein [Taibaiella sp.]